MFQAKAPLHQTKGTLKVVWQYKSKHTKVGVMPKYRIQGLMNTRSNELRIQGLTNIRSNEYKI